MVELFGACQLGSTAEGGDEPYYRSRGLSKPGARDPEDWVLYFPLARPMLLTSRTEAGCPHVARYTSTAHTTDRNRGSRLVRNQDGGPHRTPGY